MIDFRKKYPLYKGPIIWNTSNLTYEISSDYMARGELAKSKHDHKINMMKKLDGANVVELIVNPFDYYYHSIEALDILRTVRKIRIYGHTRYQFIAPSEIINVSRFMDKL